MKKRWSRKHDSCVKCNTKSIKHGAFGLCTRCYYQGYPRELKPIKSKYRQGAAWSMNYPECIRCSSTKHKHATRGVCRHCLGVERARNKRKSTYGHSEWSREHKACIECHMTDIKHMAKGLCWHCYGIKRRGETI